MTAPRTLLLNNTCEIIAFITERKAIRLVYKGKVDVVSVWQEIKLKFTNGFMQLPAILKMKYYVHRKFGKVVFSRLNVLKRDKYHCQYCQKSMTASEAEIDHVLPKRLGGKSSFENCVAACRGCNGRKGSRKLEDTELKLIRQPTAPVGALHYVSRADGWHETWENFLENFA